MEMAPLQCSPSGIVSPALNGALRKHAKAVCLIAAVEYHTREEEQLIVSVAIYGLSGSAFLSFKHFRGVEQQVGGPSAGSTLFSATVSVAILCVPVNWGQ